MAEVVNVLESVGNGGCIELERSKALYRRRFVGGQYCLERLML
jgi:hypothetical protein